jgi:hypothetical protein
MTRMEPHAPVHPSSPWPPLSSLLPRRLLPPAGLTDIQDPRAKAVVSNCLHAFCLPCLSSWLAIKRSCPLCKRRVSSYLYDIRSDALYRERELPPSPEPQLKDWEPPAPVWPGYGYLAAAGAGGLGGPRPGVGAGRRSRWGGPAPQPGAAREAERRTHTW